MILIDPEGRCAPNLPRGQLRREAARTAAISPTATSPTATSPTGTSPTGTLPAATSPGGDKHGSGESDDAGTQAVRDLGFIEVLPAREGVQIRMRPILVSGQAATQLYFSLADLKPSRVVLVRFDDERRQWRHEICGDWRHAFGRLDALVFRNDKIPAYAAMELDQAELETHPQDGLLELHLLWERSKRRFDAAALRRLDLDQHTMISTGSDRVVIKQLGAQLDIYGHAWTSTASGRDISDQPDHVFAARVAANLRRCMVLDEPLFHRVEATVRRGPRTSVQLSYRRLALPWRSADGGSVVTTTIHFDQYIEIAR